MGDRRRRSTTKIVLQAVEIVAPAPPVVASVYPRILGAVANQSIAILGAHLNPSSDITLKRTGQAAIPVTLTDTGATRAGTRLSALCDLSGASPADWDLVVRNPNGQTAVSAGAMTIVKLGSPFLQVSLTGPPVARPGRWTMYTVSVTNTGTASSYLPLVTLDGIPVGFETRLTGVTVVDMPLDPEITTAFEGQMPLSFTHYKTTGQSREVEYASPAFARGVRSAASEQLVQMVPVLVNEIKPGQTVNIGIGIKGDVPPHTWMGIEATATTSLLDAQRYDPSVAAAAGVKPARTAEQTFWLSFKMSYDCSSQRYEDAINMVTTELFKDIVSDLVGTSSTSTA